MGWLLWGVLIGWAACALLYYSQIEDERLANRLIAAGTISALLIGLLAIVISLSLVVESGSIKADPTPMIQGR